MTTQGKSKSKTFPKGTDPAKILNFVRDQIDTADIWTDDVTFLHAANSKYLITITKLPEKGEKK